MSLRVDDELLILVQVATNPIPTNDEDFLAYLESNLSCAWHYELWKINRVGISKTESNISISSGVVTNMRMGASHTGKIVLSGTTNKNCVDAPDSLYTAFISNGKIQNTQTHILSEDLFNFSADNLDLNIGYQQYSFKGIGEDNLGNIQLIWEYTYSTYTMGYFTTRMGDVHGRYHEGTETYYHDEIIVASIKSNNQLNWIKKVDKKQLGSGAKNPYQSILITSNNNLLSVNYLHKCIDPNDKSKNQRFHPCIFWYDLDINEGSITHGSQVLVNDSMLSYYSYIWHSFILEDESIILDINITAKESQLIKLQPSK